MALRQLVEAAFFLPFFIHQLPCRIFLLYPPQNSKAPSSLKVPCLFKLVHLGLNQGPPDYEY
jgi:hypothetical protein